MPRKPPIERRAGQSVEALALQLSGQESNQLTAPPGTKKEQYPEVNARVKAESIAESIEVHRKRLRLLHDNERVNLDDVDAVARAADDYLTACQLAGTVPTMLSFAPCLGWSRKAVYEYLSRNDNQTTRFLGSLQSVFAAVMAEMALKRQLSEPVSIFLLKNSGQGLVDKQEMEVHPPEDPLAEIRNSAEIRRRYIEALPYDD